MKRIVTFFSHVSRGISWEETESVWCAARNDKQVSGLWRGVSSTNLPRVIKADRSKHQTVPAGPSPYILGSTVVHHARYKNSLALLLAQVCIQERVRCFDYRLALFLGQTCSQVTYHPWKPTSCQWYTSAVVSYTSFIRRVVNYLPFTKTCDCAADKAGQLYSSPDLCRVRGYDTGQL